MTLQEIANEAIARAGEGYTSYFDRAKSLVRAALASSISKGSIQISELDGSIKQVTIGTADNLSVEDLFKINVVPSLSAANVVIYTKIDVPAHQEPVILSAASSLNQLYNAPYYALLKRGSSALSSDELMYYLDLPYMHLAWIGERREGNRIQYNITQVVTTKPLLTTNTTEFNDLMNEKCQQVLIDIVMKLLVDEINR